MRPLAAVLTLLLAAPVLGAGALESPADIAAAPPAADDTCLPAGTPVPPPPQAVCADLPLLVDEAATP